MSTKLEERASKLVKNDTCLCCVQVYTLYIYTRTSHVLILRLKLEQVDFVVKILHCIAEKVCYQ